MQHNGIDLWTKRWKRWLSYADKRNTDRNRLSWLLDYQAARRAEMGKGE